jgi:putative ABC transport system permease protein
VFIALREIRRSPGRFALLVGAVALLVLLLLFFQAVASSLTLGTTGGIDSNSADVFVYSDTARRNPAASYLPAEVAEPVAAVGGVASVAEAGRGLFAIDGVDAVVIGLDRPGAGGPATLSEGRAAERSGEAVFSGSDLAESFDLGQQIMVEGVALTVVGLADDAAFEVSPTFYVTYSDFEAAVRARVGRQVEAPVSWLGVEVAEGSDPAEVAKRITGEVDGVEALDRAAASRALPGVDQITQSFGILYLLLLIVVTIVTGVFFLILTVQKQPSLVLLRAVGASRADVVAPVLYQVLAIVGMGAVAGAVVAAGLLLAARETFGATLDLGTTAAITGFIVVLGLVASLGAVRRVLAVDPVEATTAGVA